MSIQAKTKLTLTAGFGITLTDDGIGFNGTEPVNHIISVGNDINFDGNVQFNTLTSNFYDLSGYKLFTNRWTNSFTADGSINITGNLIISGDATVGLNVTAEKIESELTSSTVLHKSGSTEFGDSIDDTHQITGSVHLSGSYSLLGYSVNEISSDVALSDSSTTTLTTENASVAYTISQLGVAGDVTPTELYLRKNYNKTATSILNSTASFTAVTASSPDGVTATSENDFIFFNNGQVMEHDALTIQQSGSIFYLIVDSDDIGYLLDDTDEIKAWGKFNA
tara:strand:+ start:190 stop:1029 length:840 start_codon:yes stop_codon:yes gene_type:complete